MIPPPIPSLIQKLNNAFTSTHEKAVIGFDGYVDYIQKVVKTARQESRSYFETIAQVGEHISAAAGMSAQLELRTHALKMGGNAPIMSHAMGCLGVKNYCVSTLGVPEIHPVFTSMHSNCTLLSIGPSATSNALEFEDGKLILSEVSSFDELDWEYIKKSKQDELVLNYINESQLIAMVDWSNLPKCSLLWHDLFQLIKTHPPKNKIFFFDLCDPAKKSKSEIMKVLEVIGLYSSIGKTFLGLNENEAQRVHSVLYDSLDMESNPKALRDVAVEIFNKLSIDTLMIHPVDRTILITKEKRIEMKGRVITSPLILTGGGDNLNAGFCFGLLHGMSEEECMLLGMATSGAYVQNGFSPSIKQVIAYLEKF